MNEQDERQGRADHLGERIIAAVAQYPFESESEGGGQVNLFCTLRPALLEDGGHAVPEEFPNNGLVWWMVRPQMRSSSLPGRLITGILERARQYEREERARSFYQIQVASAEQPSQDDVIEILTVGDNQIASVRELVNRSGAVRLDHPPTSTVLVRWRDHLYGPLRASAKASEGPSNHYVISFENPAADQTVLEMPATRLDAIAPAKTRRFDLELSGDNQPPYRTRELIRCSYEVVVPVQYKELAKDGTRVSLVSNSDIVRGLAKKVSTRKSRQELNRLLSELAADVEKTTDISDEEREALRELRSVVERDEGLADALAEDLLSSGLVDDRLQRRIDERVSQHIDERAATLQADVAARIDSVRKQLSKLEKERASLEQALQTDKLRVEREVEEHRQARLAEIEERSRRLEEKERRLADQQQIISQHLETVTSRFTEARDEVLNQFLELVPLLARTDILTPAVQPERRGSTSASTTERNVHSASRPAFELPSYAVSAAPADDIPDPSEEEFFERFESHTKAAGFSYRRLDLVSFHISVKCSDLTILGGVSGTGKSTLPRLYSEALAASEADGFRRHLAVGVSPSWLDMRDLLGHVNALDRVFHPSESGLYQQMIIAAEELRHRGSASGIYVVCLDEMNLAHVEHYFSGFLQALERPTGQRVVPVFTPHNVDENDPFARWPTIEIPRSARFVGTVNFDETTRQLSLRVLDRANLIRLGSLRLPDLNLDSAADAQAVPGVPVSLRAYQSWIGSATLDPRLGRVFDELREPLHALGCPLSPRRYRAICQFVASSNGLCSPEVALDLQVSQRILPQVRGLFRREAREALDQLEQILSQQSFDFVESRRHLQQLRLEDPGASLLVNE